MSCSHQGLLVTRSAWERTTYSNITPSGIMRSLMNRPLPVLMGWWEGAFCLWPSHYRVPHLWASSLVMLMEGHILGSSCGTRGAGSLLHIPCFLMSKASAPRYGVRMAPAVATAQAYCRRAIQGCLRGSTSLTWFLSGCQGGPPTSSEATSAHSFPVFLMRKYVIPNCDLQEQAVLEVFGLLHCSVLT